MFVLILLILLLLTYTNDIIKDTIITHIHTTSILSYHISINVSIGFHKVFEIRFLYGGDRYCHLKL